MPLNIKDEETHALARRLAEKTGKSMARAVREAVAEKLERVENDAFEEATFRELKRLAEHSASLPVLDARPADEILGYDAFGLPE